MRPWYLYPPRSNATFVTPAAFNRSAISVPTRFATSVLLPDVPLTDASSVDADASVRPVVSSMTWT